MPSSTTSGTSDPNTRWHITAAVAAWLLPGLGHYLLGQRRRGLILAVSIGGLWLGGLFIGGVSSIDRSAHPAWFLGQMLVAPSVVVEYYHHRLRSNGVVQPLPHDDPAYIPSFARTNEQGVLYTTLAGMLNLLAVIDVLYRDPRDPRHRGDIADELAAAHPQAGEGEST